MPSYILLMRNDSETTRLMFINTGNCSEYIQAKSFKQQKNEVEVNAILLIIGSQARLLTIRKTNKGGSASQTFWYETATSRGGSLQGP